MVSNIQAAYQRLLTNLIHNLGLRIRSERPGSVSFRSGEAGGYVPKGFDGQV